MGRKRKCSHEDEDCDDGKLPYQRNAANERERDRMRVLSRAFSKLKTTLPWVPSDTKLSKLDTLRLATCYIAHMRQVLAEDDGEVLPEPSVPACRVSTHPPNVTVHPLNLTWPYSFTGKFPTSLDASSITLSPCSQGCDVKVVSQHPCSQGNDVRVSQHHHYNQGCDVKLSRDLINGSS